MKGCLGTKFLKRDLYDERRDWVLYVWEEICLFAESPFRLEKVIVRGLQQNKRIDSLLRDDMRSESTVGCAIVLWATNDPIFGLGFALREPHLAWTGQRAGRQSLTEKNMDSPEAQPYSL